MPFQPLPDKGPKRPGSSDIGLFAIRLLTALTFFYYQLLGLLSKAKGYVWDKADWDLIEKFHDLGFPVPGVLASVFVVVLVLSLIAIVIGIFTRVNALILLLVSIAILIVPLSLSPSLTPQALVLYITVFLGLTLGGPGKASLDYRLAGRRKKKSGNS